MTALGDRYIDNKQVAGMVNLVMRNGKVVHYQAHGAKGASDDRPLEKDDLFRIYSMTKPITAVAAMQLYEQGKFQLSDPVAKFVPELKDVKVLNANGQLEDQDAPMTMHQLLTHTTGLSYGFAAQVDLVDQAYMRARHLGRQRPGRICPTRGQTATEVSARSRVSLLYSRRYNRFGGATLKRPTFR